MLFFKGRFVACLFLLMFGTYGLAQTKPITQHPQQQRTQPRKATITLADGSLMKGEIIKFEQDSLTITGKFGSSTINLDNIKRIDFGDEPTTIPEAQSEDKAINATRVVTKAINSLAVATESGLNYMEYRTRLADLMVVVDENTKLIKKAQVRKDIERAIANLTIARELWKLIIDVRPDPKLKEETLAEINKSVSNAKEIAKEIAKAIQ